MPLSSSSVDRRIPEALRTSRERNLTVEAPGWSPLSRGCVKTRPTEIPAQYLVSFVDSKGEYFDGSKTYKVRLPKDVPAAKFWSFIVYDNQTRSMLDTPQRYPRAGSQGFPAPSAVANPNGSATVYFGPGKPAGVSDGNGIQTMPGKGWKTILRLHSPLEPFFTKEWHASPLFSQGV
jgi:hypothetical protein